MKRTFSLIIFILSVRLLLTCSKQKHIDGSGLEYRDGLAYEIDKVTPYSGKVVSYFEDGIKQFEGAFKSGKRDGHFKAWYTNEKIKYEVEFSDDLPNGFVVYSDSSGIKLFEYSYSMGLRHEPRELSEGDIIILMDVLDIYHHYLNPTAKGFYQAYQINGDVISDEASGLMWQRSGSEGELTYHEAGQYIAELNDRKFAGYGNWRLPTLEEVMSLLENEPRHGNLFLDPIFDGMQHWVWTSDTVKGKHYHWIVRFAHGDCANNGVVTKFFVRGVRENVQ